MNFLAACVLAALAQHPSVSGVHGFSGHVLVVGPGGFTEIQPAIDAASDGDTIFVKSAYYGFTIQNKALTVVARAGPMLPLFGQAVVRDLAPSKSVLIAGFILPGYATPPLGGLVATNNAGSLRVEQCDLNGLGTAGAVLENDADVALVGFGISGSDTGHSPYNTDGLAGIEALSVNASSVAIYGCNLIGGMGGYGGTGHADLPAGNGGEGGAGLSLTSGFAYISGSVLTGGQGGWGGDSGPCNDGGQPGNGGVGGPGIVVLGTSPPFPNVVTLGNTYILGQGGPGGLDDSGGLGGPCWQNGQAGPDGTQAIIAPPGTVLEEAGSARGFSAPRVARENTSPYVTCTGLPGDFVQVFASSSPAFAYAPNLNGVILTDSSDRRLLASGTIPAGGLTAFQIALPSQGFASKRWYLQAYMRDPTNNRFVAAQVTLVELDSDY